MTFKKIITLLSVITLILSGFLFISVPDTVKGNEGLSDSSWPMYKRGPRHTGRSPYDTSHVVGDSEWEIDLEDSSHGISQPVIGKEGTIYILKSPDLLYAINPNGTINWKIDLYRISSTTTPAVGDDGTIYVSSQGPFYAINPNGTIRWKFSGYIIGFSSPTISKDGIIYVSSWDRYLFALTPDGTLKWKMKTSSQKSPVAICSDGTILAGSSDDKLYAISPKGRVEWTFEVESDIVSSPVIGDNGTIYVRTYEHLLYAVNPNGTEKWKFSNVGSIGSDPSLGYDGTVYIGTPDASLVAINSDGTKKWELDIGQYNVYSPVIGGDGTIYTSADGKLYAINPNGTIKWKDYSSSSKPIIGSDGTLYVASSYGLSAYDRGFNLEIGKKGEGSVHPYGGNNTYAIDKEIDVRAYADENWTFSHWTGDYPEGKKDERKITVTMDENKTLTAHFEKEEEDKGIPGFTVFPFVVAVGISLIYRRKGIKIDPEYSE